MSLQNDTTDESKFSYIASRKIKLVQSFKYREKLYMTSKNIRNLLSGNYLNSSQWLSLFDPENFSSNYPLVQYIYIYIYMTTL